jgi:hypothetical protein
MCDTVPYARALESFNFVPPNIYEMLLDNADPQILVDAIKSFLDKDIKGAAGGIITSPQIAQWIFRSSAELFHPNADGYRAMSASLIRWSQSEEALQAEGFLDQMGDSAAPTLVTSDWKVRSPVAANDIESLKAKHWEIQPIQLDGLFPFSPILAIMRSEPRVVASSQAGADGTVTINVGFDPSVTPGSHTIEISGTNEDGSDYQKIIPVTVEDSSIDVPALLLISLLVVSLMAASSAMFVLRRTSRQKDERVQR